MNKKLITGLVLVGFVFTLLAPGGKVLAQSSIEDLQKQISQLLELIKNLQTQLDSLRGGVTPGVKPPIISIRPEPERGWDTINGTLQAQNLDGRASFYMWGTHQITEPTRLTYPTQGGKTYLVKAVNDEVLAMLKKYEGQNVTLWGQLQYQNIEGGFWGFVAKKVIAGTTTCPLPAAGTKIGYQNESVKVIQEVLKTDKSVYPEGLVTGYYGPLTERAVTKFQTKVGLPATGVLDNETKERIEAKLEATSQSVPGSMGVTVQVDAVEDRIEDRVIRCPIPPTPIPYPIPDQGFRVYSPSAGEEWQVGRTEKIAWEQIWPTLIIDNVWKPLPLPVWTPPINDSGSGSNQVISNTTVAPIGAVRITLHRYIACLYTEPRCLIAEAMPYVISEKTDNDGIFEWAIPADLAAQYQGKMVITVSAVDGGFSGRSAVFVIGSGFVTPPPGPNLPPVVTGVSGPTSLKVGETGTWAVKAYDPENGSLSYSVIWGDEPQAAPIAPATPSEKQIQNTATFTHIYSSVGTYYPIFTVTDDKGQRAKTSMSVVVGGDIITAVKITSSPPADASGNVTIKQGDQIIITGTPLISGRLGVDYTRAFFFDPIFNGVCGNTEWVMTCTAKQTGTSNFYIELYKGGQTFRSNVIRVTVIQGTTTNSPPKITGISAIPTPIYVGQQVAFSWSATDADGDRLTWWIDWGDRTASSCPMPVEVPYEGYPVPVQDCNSYSVSHAWSTAGTYTVVAQVNDPKGGFDSHKFNVTVSPGIVINQPPVIKTFQFQNGVTSLSVGQMYALNFLAIDPEGTQVKYTIDFGDGTVETANMFAAGTTGTSLHTYNTVGTKTLKLTATDAQGLSATQSLTVNVVSQNLDYQIINFTQGWNFISFNRLPDGRDLRGIFTDPWFGYIDYIKTVENGQELVYDKANNVQTLQKIEFGKGYKVHATQPFSMYVYGYGVGYVVGNLAKVNDTYTNYIGNPMARTMSVGEFFKSIADKVTIVKGAESFWIPGVLTSGLTTIEPGKAYEVGVKENVNFVFP